MPGRIMENTRVNGTWDGGAQNYGEISSIDKGKAMTNGSNGQVVSNGLYALTDRALEDGKTASTSALRNSTSQALANLVAEAPPELVHITEGFFPLAKLINRTTQQCWLDLNDLINDLAEIAATSNGQSNSNYGYNQVNGKGNSAQTDGSAMKKTRILQFAQRYRADFIKLLVISEWARQSTAVSKVIDIQGWIHSQNVAYDAAIWHLGDMKRNLAMAQMPNPDLKTALEVLVMGTVSSLSDVSIANARLLESALNELQLGYIPPKPLTSKKLLKTLKSLNEMLCIRLAGYESIPDAFKRYRIRDGRVTFTVPQEFELDLSIAEKDHESQLYFIDLRFLFSPAPTIPDGRLRADIEAKTNTILRSDGLEGCFKSIHDLVLTNKINALYRQALALARSQWSGYLRVEMIRRTLVIQYWGNKPGPKNWIEIGIRSGRQDEDETIAPIAGAPYLGLRWIRDGKETDSTNITFDVERLSVDQTLRSVVATHMTDLITSLYHKLSDVPLYTSQRLDIEAQPSYDEPSDVFLQVQLTASKTLTMSMEPVTGRISLRPASEAFIQAEDKLNASKTPFEDALSRICSLRCLVALEEAEARFSRSYGWTKIQSSLSTMGGDIHPDDLRKVTSSKFTHFCLLRMQQWDSECYLGATISMEGDRYWILHRNTGSLQAGISKFSAALSVPDALLDSSDMTMDEADDSIVIDTSRKLSSLAAVWANKRFLESMEFQTYPDDDAMGAGFDVSAARFTFDFDATRVPAAWTTPNALKCDTNALHPQIAISVGGLDDITGQVYILARGRIREKISDMNSKSSGPQSNDSLTLSSDGRFSMRFLAPVGKPVIEQVMNHFQRLMHVVSCLQTLRLHGYVPVKIGLRDLSFRYDKQDPTSICAFRFYGHEEDKVKAKAQDPAVISRAQPASQTPSGGGLALVQALLKARQSSASHTPSKPEKDSPDPCPISVHFSRNNPLSRLGHFFTSLLNRTRKLSAFSRVLEITVPLMRAIAILEAAQSPPSPDREITMSFTSEGSTTHHIQYSSKNFQRKFKLGIRLHKDDCLWSVEDTLYLPTTTKKPLITQSATSDRFDELMQEQVYDVTSSNRSDDTTDGVPASVPWTTFSKLITCKTADGSIAHILSAIDRIARQAVHDTVETEDAKVKTDNDTAKTGIKQENVPPAKKTTATTTKKEKKGGGGATTIVLD